MVMVIEQRHQKMEASILESLCIMNEMVSQGPCWTMSLIGGRVYI